MNYSDDGADDYLRFAIAKVFGRDMETSERYARAHWGASSPVTKALVGGLESPATAVLASDFAAGVAALSAFDNIRFRRLVDKGQPLARSSASTIAVGIVGEGAAIPVSAWALHWEQVPILKIGAVVVTSRDALKLAGKRTVRALTSDLQVATADKTDEVLLTALGADGATIVIAASGTIATDVDAAIGAFPFDLRRATWITDPITASKLAAVDDNVTVTGNGSLRGLPLLVTPGSLRDSDGGRLWLVSGPDILMVDDGIDVAISFDGSIEQRTDPTGDVLAPTAVTAAGFTSLFQEDAAAIRAVRRFGYLPATGAAVVIDSIA